MKFHNSSICSAAGLGGLRLDAADAAAVATLLFGTASAPAWDDLERLGPIHFAAEAPAQANATPFTRDFGDSVVQCRSGDAAVAQVLAQHRPARPGTPTAYAFAFAQQWARLGCACVHGALLRVQDVGVLVLGARAAGKSVLAASALAAGGVLISDDFLLLGQREGDILGERIRTFVSLRRGWAANTLLQGLGGVWGTNATGNRAFLRVPQDDARFPASARIDRLWLLSRPRSARAAQSSLRPLTQAQAYAAVVAAIQPLLLGAEFPVERKLLGNVIARLVALPAARLETGQDIVTAPRQAWSGLLRQR